LAGSIHRTRHHPGRIAAKYGLTAENAVSRVKALFAESPAPPNWSKSHEPSATGDPSPAALAAMRKPSLLIVWLTVFIDLIGFGIVVPLIPVFATLRASSVWVIGLVAGLVFRSCNSSSLPIWGRLSDRVGRRPVLLFSTAGAAVSYVIFAIGSGLENPTQALITLGIARACAGAFGGNITVAQAYIADITPAAQRSKGWA
jgi:MFS transporter, DHA1 family, tetracycline resistance protein